MVLKGCSYVLLGLPNSAGRLFADVDLLAAEAELDSVERILNRNGWRGRELTPYDDNYYRKWTHELPPLVHVEREVEIDLHHNIVPRTARLKPPAKALMAKAMQLPTSGFYVLSNEDLVLHAMVHLMFDSDLGDKLRDLVDIGDLLMHFSGRDDEFWNKLVDRATDLGLSRPLYYSIRYCGRLLHLPIPEAVIGRLGQFAPNRLTVALMDRLVPRALFPIHPDRESRSARASRLLLYARSHWLRMPPWLLVYHLTYKFLARRASSRSWRS